MIDQVADADLSEFDAGGDRKNELFDVLSNPRRRCLLHALQTAETPVSVRKLTAEVVAREAQRTASERSDDEWTAIETSLVHSHLPKMSNSGFVKYDENRGTVANTGRTAEAWEHLQTMGPVHAGSD